jgi:ADP-heptose:LPS heptosyltransferase
MSFFRLCGAKDVRGHNFPILPHDWQPTEAERLIRILHQMGIQGEKPGYDIPVDAASRESVKAKLRAAGVDPGSPFLLFCGGGKAPTQLWPFERYAKVLPRIAADTRWPVVAFGAPQEITTYRNRILPQFSNLKILPDPLSIPELFELCRLAKAYFGNETGPMHVAASVDCPVAVVMSARTPPGSWYPDVVHSQVVQLRVECESCLIHDCVAEKHRCMTGLTEDRVLAEVLPFLKQLPDQKGK